MDKKKFKFSIVLCIVAVLCLATLFSAIFVMQNATFNMAEQISQETPITNDYIIDDSLIEYYESLPNTTASLAEADSTDIPSKYCLRDDYIIYTQDQDRNGLCWAFAGNMSAATTLMKATGQYYDFSEAWVSLAYASYSASYIYGDGGNHYIYNNVLNNYGLVLESDMQYNNSYTICDQNKEAYYDYYSQFANKDIAKNLESASYSKSNIDAIKSHIYNYGSLELSAYWNSSVGSSGISTGTNSKFYYKCPASKSGSGAHAISIIGWDDEISFTYNSTTYTGAWLCLNSWGNGSGKDGLIYVAYDDTDVYGIAGYTYKTMEETTGLSFQNEVSSVKVNDAEYTYTTNLKGKYYTGFSETTNETKQKNVIFSGSEGVNSFEMTYNYSLEDKTNGLDVSVDNVSIFKGQEDITSNFSLSITTLEVDNPHFYLQTDVSLSSGAYKIIVNYSTADGSLTGSYFDVFYIMDGNELAKVTCYVYGESNIKNNGQYQIYNSYNYESSIINLATTKTSGTVKLYYTPATYSTISSNSGDTNISFSGLSETSITKQLTKNNVIINLCYINKDDLTNNKWVNFYYGTDGGVANNNSRLVVNQTDGVVLAEPTKAGYTFAGWYYDKDYTLPLSTNVSGEYIFEYSKVSQLQNDTNHYDKDGYLIYLTPNLYAQSYYHSYLDGSCMAFVYAKWDEGYSFVLTADNTTPYVGEAFTLTLESETLQLIHGFGVSIELRWYLNDTLQTTTSNSGASDMGFMSLEQTINVAGVYTYYVIIVLGGVEEDTIQTDSIIITVQTPPVTPPDPVESVDFLNGNFTWSKVADADGYVVIVYCRNSSGVSTTESVIENNDSATVSFTLTSSFITSAGAYYIGVKAYKLDGEKKVCSNEAKSQDEINFYEISYTTYSIDKASEIVQEGTTLDLTGKEPEAKAGYTFKYWCIDENRQTAFVDGSAVTDNLTLYADWTMNDINNISTVADIEKEYDKQSSNISVSPTHESGLTNFSYVWYKQDQQGQPVVLDGETNNSISVFNVADSGTYFCKVTLTDADGFSVTNNTNDIVVAISKATTSIDISGIVTEYTYDGKEHIISSGAKLVDKNDEDVSGIDLEYTIDDTEYRYTQNSFINVPLAGEFTLTIRALGNDNYKEPEEEQVQITVHKATSAISLEKQYQFFRYTGKPIMPEFSLGNDEQTVVPDSQPINKGEYDVTLTAQESQNYKSATVNVHITVNPANIYIKANDIMGVLFAKQQKLTYTIIEGEVYGNDDLGIELHSDVNTGKLGNYSISISSNNENYKIAVFEGNYRVTAWPYYVGFFVILFLSWFIISALKKRRYQYEFETNGGDIVSPIDTKNKGAITLDEPYKEGYKFVGWYTDMELTKPFKNKYRKSKGKTLYAKWEKIDGTMSLSEELQTAQEIVDEIQAIINPKQEQKQETQETPVEEKPKEKTEEEKMQEIVDSVTTKQSSEYSKEELEQFIKRITDKD